MRALSLVLAGLACLPLAAQESNVPVIRSTSQEVLLDAVVRDKKERMIRNLKPDEIRGAGGRRSAEAADVPLHRCLRECTSGRACPS